MASRKRGFLRRAALIIRQNPGLTAQETARCALRSGVESSAQNPVGSLVASLHASYQKINVERRKEGGVYRFYPKGGGDEDSAPPVIATPLDDDSDGGAVVSVRLSSANLEVVDALVSGGRYGSRSEALAYLVDEGIAANREDLKPVVSAYRALKKAAHTLSSKQQ